MGESFIHGILANRTIVPIRVVDNGDGTGSLELSATLSPGDFEIGAVEIKDHTTDNRASVTAAGEVATRTINRADWAVRTLDTGETPNTPIAGPAQAVPDGFGVAVVAAEGNTDDVTVGGVGDTGATATSFVLGPGDRLPITLKVSNLNLIEARSASATQLVKLIVEI